MSTTLLTPNTIDWTQDASGSLGTPPVGGDSALSSDDGDTSYIDIDGDTQVSHNIAVTTTFAAGPTAFDGVVLGMSIRPLEALDPAGQQYLEARVGNTDFTTTYVSTIPFIVTAAGFQIYEYDLTPYLTAAQMSEPFAVYFDNHGYDALPVGMRVSYQYMKFTSAGAPTTVTPPVRQYPRDDYLGHSPRQFARGGSSSRQASNRQGLRGTYL